MASAKGATTRPLVILKGGPRSRFVYYETDWAQTVKASAALGKPQPYHETDSTVSIGEVYKYLPDASSGLSQTPAKIWLYHG